MGSSSSATDSEVKESDKYDYMERYYDEIKAGKYRTKNPNATLRCPFCEAKKKQEFQFKDLLQHASGIGTCSAKRSMQVRVKHLALEKYLKQDVSTELDIVVKPPQYLEVANEQPSSEGRFVWPWKGIVASIFRKPKNETEEYWLRKFELYKPKEAHVLHGKDDPRGYVVLEFGTEWTGYRQVMKLDTDFQTDCHGKKDWDSMMECPGSDLYAWIVGAEEYNSEGMVGDYLREKAVLKTVSEVSQDLWKECTEKVETNYSERSFSLMNIMAGREELTEAHIEEMQRMEQNAREHARRIIEETEYLKNQIYTRNGELARLGHQLSEKEKSTIHERRKFEEEKKKITESLILASEEQVKAKDDIAEVLKKHKMEEKAMRDTLLKLEKDLNDEHKLKIEIAELDEQLKVLNCMNVMGADSEKGKISKKEIEEMEGKLEEIIEKMSEKEDVNQVLEMKEQLAKKELEDAREAFIAEELHPHFSLPKVIGELFNLAKTLFGIEIEPADGLAPVWNNDVKFFRVKDSSGSPIAYFYFDPYSRPAEKRQGAWMDEMFARSRVLSRDGTSTRFPVAHMLCNQTSPVGNKPSLMTFCEDATYSLRKRIMFSRHSWKKVCKLDRRRKIKQKRNEQDMERKRLY